MAEHLKFIDSHVMQKFGKINPNTDVPDERRHTAPYAERITGPPPTSTLSFTPVLNSYLHSDC